MYPQRELPHVVKSRLLAVHFMGSGDVTETRLIQFIYDLSFSEKKEKII